jgi:hypothetical protein
MPMKNPKEMISIFPDFQPMRIKYKDVFDLKAFYESLHEWLLEKNWTDPDKALIDTWENFYGERIAANGMREIWIQWRPIKFAGSELKGTGSKYINYYLDFDFHCLAITNTEIVRNGKKIKLNKGEVELKIRAYLETTYEKELRKYGLIKPFIELFNRKIYKGEIDLHKKELYQESYELQNFIKQWFKLKRYLPYEEAKVFFTSQAYPSHLKE